MAERARRMEQQRMSDSAARDREGTPEWYNELKEQDDEESRELLDGADSDVDEVERRLRERDEAHDPAVDNPYTSMLQPKLGSATPMRVLFRGFDPANAWFWLDLYEPPQPRELEVIEEAVQSWFMLGRLGGFNAGNLQVQNAAEADLSYQPYHHEPLNEDSHGLYHDMGDIEVNNKTIRWRVDMGTGDEMGLDVLINALRTVSVDYCGIQAVHVGGQHAEWPIPDEFKDEFEMQPLQSQEVYEQTEEEYWAKYEDELAERLEELREKHPDKVKELEEAEAEWRKTPEGQFQTAQENAQEALELREQGLQHLMEQQPQKKRGIRRAHHNPLYDFGADFEA